jgi:site-specific DNA-methyltransferase (adenine-specific)
MLDYGFYNMDCMDGMKQFPDKYFDLAIVDPPYGGAGQDVSETFNDAIVGRFGGTFEKYFKGDKRGHMGGGHAKQYGYGHWDIAPSKEYFNELFRVSKNQIIWGGNYFELPPTRCFLIWRKTNVPEKFSMAMCEYAWTSFNDNAKMFEYSAVGQKGRFHPTQKPVELYKWILLNYAQHGDKILDTHVGSASSLIACRESGFQYVGFEIDEEYFKMAQKRLQAVEAQMNIFDYAFNPYQN